MKLSIYGYGYVGKAMEALLKDAHELVISDPDEGHRPNHKKLAESEIAIICVPTPALQDGRCDTSIVESVVQSVPQRYVLIKSTIEPGTTQKLIDETGKDIVFSPEYISESTYHNPYYKTMRDTPFVVLGGTKAGRRKIIECLQDIYGPMMNFFQCEPTEAEVIKYMANIYSAMKVTFVNEMYDLSESLGVDWNTVRQGWLLDERVEPMSTMVFPSRRGYSGKCLPKDTLALARLAETKGLELNLLSAIHNQNLKYAFDRLIHHIPLETIASGRKHSDAEDKAAVETEPSSLAGAPKLASLRSPEPA